MVSNYMKQNLVIFLLEIPILSYIVLGRLIYDRLIPMLGPQGAYIVYWLGFAFVGAITIQLFLAIRQSALKQVAGRRYLVGHVYDPTGKADPIQLQLGEYSLLGETKDKAKIYVVWMEKDGRRIMDYVLVSPKELDEVLSAASIWTVDAGWWFADAQVYPVTLYMPEGKAVDVFRQEVELPQSIPIYIIRDAPGLIVNSKINDKKGKEAEEMAIEARKQIDLLRSRQLMAENQSLRAELEAMSRSEMSIRALANKKLGALASALIEGEKRAPKPFGWRPDKWFWIAIMVISILVFGYWALSKWFAIQAMRGGV